MVVLRSDQDHVSKLQDKKEMYEANRVPPGVTRFAAREHAPILDLLRSMPEKGNEERRSNQSSTFLQSYKDLCISLGFKPGGSWENFSRNFWWGEFPVGNIVYEFVTIRQRPCPPNELLRLLFVKENDLPDEEQNPTMGKKQFENAVRDFSKKYVVAQDDMKLLANDSEPELPRNYQQLDAVTAPGTTVHPLVENITSTDDDDDFVGGTMAVMEMAESLKAMAENSTAKNESIQKLAEQQHKKSIQDQKKSIQDTIANASMQISNIRSEIRKKKANMDQLSEDTEYGDLVDDLEFWKNTKDKAKKELVAMEEEVKQAAKQAAKKKQANKKNLKRPPPPAARRVSPAGTTPPIPSTTPPPPSTTPPPPPAASLPPPGSNSDSDPEFLDGF